MSMSAARLGQVALLFGLVTPLLPLDRTQDSLTLPQESQAGRLSDAALAAVRNWVGVNGNVGGVVPSIVQTAIMQALPGTFQTACPRLMDEWAGIEVGLRASGMSGWSIARTRSCG